MLLEQVSLQKLKVGSATIEYYLDSGKSHIEVISLRVPQKMRRKGAARAAMEHLVHMADDRGLTISLLASPLDKKTHLGKLVKFYQSFGFEIGEKGNMAGDPWMHREPVTKLNEDKNYKGYPLAGPTVDGLKVRKEIPNMDSIAASLNEYEIMKGVRELPFSDFGGPRSVFYAADDLEKSKRLAAAIQKSGEINPLIIVIDNQGPYILEGAHRFVALYYLKKKSFPALVVMDTE